MLNGLLQEEPHTKEPGRNKVSRSSSETGSYAASGPHNRVTYFGAAPNAPEL